MRRAMVLITVLLAVCLSTAVVLDGLQSRTARRYLSELPGLRGELLARRYEDAYLTQAELHARWQQDSSWLNCLVSHHHTRAVNTAMIQLATAIDRQWPEEALKALDALEDALGDVERSDALALNTFL